MSCPIPARAATPNDDDDTVSLPSAEALLAGTLALMTGVVERAALAQPLAAHGQSQLMASKVRVNLRGLVDHPQLSEPFRATVRRLVAHWDRLAAPAAEAGLGSGTAVRHPAPPRLQ